MVDHFCISRRNPGHWDIASKEGRLYRIRGGPGDYWVNDERLATYKVKGEYPIYKFKSLIAAIGFICDDLMHELIIAEGQEPVVIESWNISLDNQ